MQSALRNIVLAVALAGFLAGCGTRGALDAPESAKNAASADAESGQGKPEGATGKEHKGFVLDGLLR